MQDFQEDLVGQEGFGGNKGVWWDEEGGEGWVRGDLMGSGGFSEVMESLLGQEDSDGSNGIWWVRGDLVWLWGFGVDRGELVDSGGPGGVWRDLVGSLSMWWVRPGRKASYLMVIF